MKRTAGIWLAVVMNRVLLTGGAGMTGQAPWVTETQAHLGRADVNEGYRNSKNANGLGNYHYRCGGYPAHLYPNGACPYAGGGKSTRTKIQTQTEIQTQAQTQVQTQAQAAIREISGAGEAPGTSGWCRNGAQWNYICEDGTWLIGCWKQIDGVQYCLDSDGNMRAGWYGGNGSLYYLGTSGKMVVGTCVADGKEYQFDRDRKMI